ncbi:glycoside hydrolase family 3 protein [Pedobacter sp. L105]|uniref:glycoside hydrolase family 3 protein n=1 Tax=Pedobacter sp. L105 TaxID=1641871 RepID=UPI00131DECDF|nr:glycoside hydrolase family 3 N-terminal domain-containing protein [Pedobacter sp. L105]
MIQKQLFSLTIFLLSITFFVQAQQKSYIQTLREPNPWVDSVFHHMSRRDKIAQLFFVRALTSKGQAYEDSIGHVIKKEHIGGLVFFQGGPGREAILINKYQEITKVPLLIASDGEWGLGMRLDSTISYPYQMALGAIQDKNLIYKMGLEVAKDFKRIGVQMNLGPDADINNNPENPIINYRSFGENKYNVALKAAAYMKGMQDGGLLVTVKHFPGHGDTDVDSHLDLPQLNFTRARLDSLEMYPFRELIAAGASGIMVAHMNIPSLDTTKNLPSTLSKPIVTGILKDELGFRGLVVSDAMEMKGVVKNFKDGEADVLGVIAGNNILELSENSKRAVKLVRKAIRHKRIPMERIDESVRKILIAKYWSGLNVKTKIDEQNVNAGVNRAESLALLQQLADSSMTLLNGSAAIQDLSTEKRTVVISIGTPALNVFQHELAGHYKNAILLNLDKMASADDIAKVTKGIDPSDQVIVSIHDTRTRPGNGMAFSPAIKSLISTLAEKNSVFAFFANPYNLAGLPGIEKSRSLIVAYQKDDYMQKAAAGVIAKQFKASGKLPVTASPNFKYGDGQ